MRKRGRLRQQKPGMGEKGAGRAGGAKEAEREVEQEQQRGRHRGKGNKHPDRHRKTNPQGADLPEKGREIDRLGRVQQKVREGTEGCIRKQEKGDRKENPGSGRSHSGPDTCRSTCGLRRV